MTRFPLPFSLIITLPLVFVQAAPAAEAVGEKEINAALASPDSHLRHNTWTKLNPENDSQFNTIVQILKHPKLSWYDRDGAILALAKAASEPVLKKMAKELKENKDPMVRQGMAIALVKTEDEKLFPQVFEALKDKSLAVRRMVVHWLGVTKKSKDKVEALVSAFQKEDDPVVKSFFVDALNAQTQAFRGPNPAPWATWWEQAKLDKDYELGKTDDQALAKAEELGNKLKKSVTVVADVTLETEERGEEKKGPGAPVPILILPDYGYSSKTMLPFFSELEKTNRCIYIELPGLKSFKDLVAVGKTGSPYFPIDKLVAAFEELRKQKKQERFALMACGMNCWIAMRYASLYPQSVSHMVLICPVGSTKAFGDVTEKMKKQGESTGDIELWHLGLGRKVNLQTGKDLHEIYHEEKKLPKPEGEDESLHRRSWSLFFRDERDSLISMLYPDRINRENASNFLIPDFTFSSQAKRNIPTIVIAGKACLYANVEDCKQIAKHYGGQFYVYENSSFMPFAEESAVFNKHMALLLKEKPRSKK
jgi:pimeloyl-ACP methyl ester carboxylesterase